MDWLDILTVQGTLKSLQQHPSSKAPILRCSASFMVQHPYVTTGKTAALTMQTLAIKVMSLLFNTKQADTQNSKHRHLSQFVGAGGWAGGLAPGHNNNCHLPAAHSAPGLGPMLQSLFHTLSDLTSPTLITLALVILIVIAQASSHTTPSLVILDPWYLSLRPTPPSRPSPSPPAWAPDHRMTPQWNPHSVSASLGASAFLPLAGRVTFFPSVLHTSGSL